MNDDADGGRQRYTSELGEFYDRRCAHPAFHTVRTKLANGTTQFRTECDMCGHIFGPAVSRFNAAGTFREPDIAKREAYDKAREHERRLIVQRFEEERAGRDAAWWARYHEYMNSDEWFRLRARVMERAHGACEGCGTAKAAHVHHLTYKHFGDELMFELVAVCVDCHDKCHSDDE